jgi:hypothetical protein
LEKEEAMFRFDRQNRQLDLDVAFHVLELTALVAEITEVEYKHIICPVCGVRPLARVGSTRVRFDRDIEMTDFSSTAEGEIARDCVFRALAQARLSGWRQGSIEVDVVPELSHIDANYYELVVVGHTFCYAQIVGLTKEQECRECGHVAYHFPDDGLEMPLECWDGSDIFVIDELPGVNIVTNSFRQVIEANSFTGVAFTPIEYWRP